ncbi:hypothetical protein PR003_g17880 [Phytophthora rubi]|uniref:Protein kinase domain-containing protein n=2 Tax=Phytophthora rubi TaxID=129364 RepID=A0A6A4ELH8_9STRA|nr:hypothetical protein PR003_g17880 [Phytophthora rubi]
MDVIETDRADVQVNSAGATSYVNSYKIMQMLGEGTFSKVYLCQNEAGDEFALKVINKSILKRKREYKRVDGKLVLSNAFQKVQKEVAIMKKLAHPNLVRLYEVIDSPADDKLFLVLELIRGGQIMYWDDKKFRYFARNKSTGVLGKDAVRECLRDVVAALDFLHRNHICHRDIKPENILLSGDQFKLADFGVAYMNEDAPAVAAKPEDASLRLRSTEGTYHFLAPECTTGDEYDPYQVDVWALGVTMFTLLVGTLPFGTSVASLSDVMTSIREDALILPPDLDPECAELLTLLMEKNPRLRITIPQLKTHPWVSRAGGELDRRSSGLEVMVTQQEIEAAFTPVNNFILVMKLKMKMSSRLNNARKSLASSPNSKRQVEAVPVTKHVPVSSSQLTADKSDGGNERTLPKTMEMAPSEQPRAMNDRLQRRSSRLVESISETVGSLTATMTRRKSQIGAISPIFDSAATIASSPVPGEGSPGKSDASGRPGVLLRTMSRRNSSLIPDISQRTDSAKAPGTLYPGKGDGEAEETSTSKAEEAKILAYRLTKRKSTSLRGFSRIIETPEGPSTSESSSPTNRKKRRESLQGKKALPAPDTSVIVGKDASPRKTETDNAPPRRLTRKNSMSFRALATPDVSTPVGGNESEVKVGSAGQSMLPPEGTADVQSSARLATTRPVILCRRLSTRSSRSIRSLNISSESPAVKAQTKPSPSSNETPQVQPSPAREGLGPVAVSPVHTNDESPVKSCSRSPTRVISAHLSRRHSMSFRALDPMPQGSMNETDEKQGETSSKGEACNMPSTESTGNESAVGVGCSSLNPPSPTCKMSRRLSRRASSSFRALPLTIDIPKHEEDPKGGEDSASRISPSELSPIRTAVDTSIPTARAASPSSSNSDTATSPRMSSPNSPLGTLKTKVSPFAMQSEDQALQPIRKEKLPVLDMHLSPISSPVTSPAASPRKTGASGDVETTVESTPRRRSSSPSKTIGFEGRALLKASPLSRKRSSSLTLDGFSSSSDEGEKQSESHPDNIVKSVSPTTRPTLEDPVSPKPRRRATVSNVPTSPLPDPDKRPQSPVEGDDPDSVLTRKSSLQKVLDACLTADRAADRNVDTVASPLEATETPVTPTRRHQVQVPPLVRPPVDHPLDSSLSHGRHHQIAPLASIEKPMRIEAAVESDSKSPSRTRRRSIVQAQDSLRVLFGGKSSIRLSMLEEKRDANHPNVTPDNISTIKSKVCGIM